MEFTNVLIPAAIFAGLGVLLGILLAVASRVFAVKTDERVEKITEALPGANCGGCGYSGCAALAEAIVRGEAPANACRAGGAACAGKIGAVMGISVTAQAPVRAKVLCSGACGKAKEKSRYEGVQDCIAADRMYGSDKLCAFGCMGLGSCVEVCKYGAISVRDGVAGVDLDRCTGCGACASVCPKHLITLVPVGTSYTVECHSSDNGAAVRKVCEAGCIGCRICEKNCPTGAVRVTDNLAVIDPLLCTGCGTCAAKCPRGVIRKSGDRWTGSRRDLPPYIIKPPLLPFGQLPDE